MNKIVTLFLMLVSSITFANEGFFVPRDRSIERGEMKWQGLRLTLTRQETLVCLLETLTLFRGTEQLAEKKWCHDGKIKNQIGTFTSRDFLFLQIPHDGTQWGLAGVEWDARKVLGQSGGRLQGYFDSPPILAVTKTGELLEFPTVAVEKPGNDVKVYFTKDGKRIVRIEKENGLFQLFRFVDNDKKVELVPHPNVKGFTIFSAVRELPDGTLRLTTNSPSGEGVASVWWKARDVRVEAKKDKSGTELKAASFQPFPTSRQSARPVWIGRLRVESGKVRAQSLFARSAGVWAHGDQVFQGEPFRKQVFEAQILNSGGGLTKVYLRGEANGGFDVFQDAVAQKPLLAKDLKSEDVLLRAFAKTAFRDPDGWKSVAIEAAFTPEFWQLVERDFAKCDTNPAHFFVLDPASAWKNRSGDQIYFLKNGDRCTDQFAKPNEPLEADRIESSTDAGFVGVWRSNGGEAHRIPGDRVVLTGDLDGDGKSEAIVFGLPVGTSEPIVTLIQEQGRPW